MHPSASPSAFKLDGGPVGVLMVHGFTGSPAEMRPIADYLHARGFRVSAPLLPGHGTSPADLNRVAWTDWTTTAEQALAELRAQCAQVFIVGLSMGALLTLYLAAEHPEILGAVVYSPALIVTNRLARLIPLGKYLVPMFPKRRDHQNEPAPSFPTWSYDRYPTYGAHEVGKLLREVRRLLPSVECPLLIVHSAQDRNIRPKSAQIVYEQVGSTQKELVMLEDSGHTLTVDREWELVAERTYQFIRDRVALTG